MPRAEAGSAQGSAFVGDSRRSNNIRNIFQTSESKRYKRIIGEMEVSLTVSNLEASLKFFTEGLGLYTASPPSSPTVVVSRSEAGMPVVTLREAKPTSGSGKTKAGPSGLDAYVALRVDSENMLESLYNRVRSMKGVKIKAKPEAMFLVGKAKHCLVTEPSGNSVEIVYWP